VDLLVCSHKFIQLDLAVAVDVKLLKRLLELHALLLGR
jgi:hypothetical protein